MMVDPVAFWTFKARCAELDLEMLRQRTTLEALRAAKNQTIDAFARAHGLDALKPLVLEDTDCSVTQA
jgi:hypothetical protein